VTEDQQQMILNLVRAGNGLVEAAAFADMPLDDLEAAVYGHRHEDIPNQNFAKALSRTLAEADLRDMAALSSAASDSWQAASRRMEERRIRQDEMHFRHLRELTTDG
jgi:hypothetical protein